MIDGISDPQVLTISPLERWVETWFFNQPMEQFDPECDVEVIGYPARSVVDVATGDYL
ncbi:MAG: hypothetical protein M3P85_07635 [Actinomycetota bacterium]|nr:hypothetical protein [Actinomycetota bacterium]